MGNADNELFTNALTIALGDKVNCSLKDLQDTIKEVASDYCIARLQTTMPSTTDGSTTRYLCQKFIEHKTARGMKTKTVKQYIYAIQGLCNQVGKEVTLITSEDIVRYLDYYRFNGNNKQPHPVSDRAVQNKYLLLSSFYGFLAKQKYLAFDPMDMVDMPKASDAIKKPLSAGEKEQLTIACTNLPKSRKGQKERAMAIITFAIESCCRVEELCSLNVSDVDFKKHTATVREGKGKKNRVVVFGEKSAIRLEEYLRLRDDIEKESMVDIPLFASLDKNHHRLCTDAVRDIIKGVADVSGIDRIHPHLLRTTGATDLIKNGVPLTVVAEQLGHESIETTNIYTKIDVDTSRTMIFNSFK